jgi:hypothetical protein
MLRRLFLIRVGFRKRPGLQTVPVKPSSRVGVGKVQEPESYFFNFQGDQPSLKNEFL